MNLDQRILRVVDLLKDARAGARQLARDVVRPLLPGRVQTFLVSGLVRGRVPATMRYVGTREALEEAVRLLFQGEATVAAPGCAAGADIEVREAFFRAAPPGFVTIQPWLSARCAPGRDYETHLKSRVSETIRQTIKKAKNRGLTLSSSLDVGDLPSFYEEMFLPYVQRRFGKGSMIAPLAFLQSHQNRTSHVEILRVLDRDVAVGAALLVHHHAKDVVSILAYGASGDGLSDRVLREQWMALVNDHVFAHACKHGLEVDVGLTAPFLDDGVFSYKRRWGCVLGPAKGMTRFFVRITPLLAPEILSAAPLFFVDEQGVCGRAARMVAEPTADKALVERLKLAAFAGLRRMEVVDITGARAPEGLAATLAARGVELRMLPALRSPPPNTHLLPRDEEARAERRVAEDA